jgi:hypothetical protein
MELNIMSEQAAIPFHNWEVPDAILGRNPVYSEFLQVTRVSTLRWKYRFLTQV